LQKTFDDVDTIALACIYFNYKESTSTDDVIANLLKQLLERNDTLSKAAKDLYDSHHRKRETHINMKDISQLFNVETAGISSFFIIVDALDECAPHESTWAEMLIQLQKIPKARIMVPGRTNIQGVIDSKCEDYITKEIVASNEDIRKSIETQIQATVHLSKAIKTNPTLGRSVLEGILKKANGMYPLTSQTVKC
jgi:hypothetical protein